MKIKSVLFIVLLPLNVHANSMCKQNDRVVFSCNLEGKSNEMNACFNEIDNTMYFSVFNNEEAIIYKPYKGVGLSNFKIVTFSNIQGQIPYTPLKFQVDEKRNAYFSANRAGARLSIMDSEAMYEDKNSIDYFCTDDPVGALEWNVRSRIKTVQPNKFEAWD